MKGSSISCIHDFYLGIIMQKFDLGSNAEINPLLTLQNNTDAQFLEPKKVFFVWIFIGEVGGRRKIDRSLYV